MKGYLIRLTGVAILAAVLRKIAPEGSGGKVTRLGAGLLILLTALGPLGSVDLMAGARQLVENSYVGGYIQDDLQETTNDLMEELIKESTRTYILDKAQELGLVLSVEVETVVQNGYPVPWRASLRGTYAQTERETMERLMEEELGIPRQRQNWQ